MRRLGLALTLALLGCARDRGEPPAPAEPAPSASDEAKGASGVLATLSAHLAFAPRVAAAIGLRGEPEGVSLPARASDGFTLARGGFGVHVRPEGLPPSGAERAGAARVFRGVAPSTDAVVLTDGDAIEDAWVLRGPDAPTTLRWEVHAADGATVRLREDRVEIVDASGYVRLAAAPPFAIDARGVRRELRPALEPLSVGASASPAGMRDARLTIDVDPRGLAYPIAVDPVWSAAAPMRVARQHHAALLLSTGKVLVVGGGSAAAELYDPATNTWSDWGTLLHAPKRGAVVFPSGPFAGKVLAIGGTAVELFDPTTKSSIAKASLPSGGLEPVVTLLGDGRVLVAGGDDVAPTSYTYTPPTDAWTKQTMQVMRIAAAGALLSNGKVLVAGGATQTSFLGGAATSSELFDPTSNSWTATATSMQDGRVLFPMISLDGGKTVFAIGGELPTGKPSTYYPTANIDLFTVATGAWSHVTTTLPTKHGDHPVAALQSGAIGVFGGDAAGFGVIGAAVDVFDPRVPNATSAAALPSAMAGHTATVLPSGAVLVAGGGTSFVFSQATLGASCSLAYECASGSCVNGACCSTASCPAGYACNVAGKPGYCAKAKGASCGGDAECATGHCADGVCCDQACNGQCEACAQGTNVGTCLAVNGAPKAGHASCATGSDVCSTATCNGADRLACHVPPNGTACGAASCTTTAGGAIATEVSTCNTGVCQAKTKNCGAYGCNGTVCNTTCTTSAQCFLGFYCDVAGAACKPLEGLGAKCSATSPCTSPLTCVDGVCCSTPSCSAGSSCANAGHEGTCTKNAGASCKADPECASGHCADGVCCDAVCTGACEACDTSGAIGTCTALTGAPHAGHPQCAPGTPGDACSAPTCDGKVRTGCAGFAGSAVPCRAAGCANGVVTQAAVCDGAGACPAVLTSSCGGFICDATGKGCMTSCSTSNQCVEGYECVSGACTNKAAKCSDDGLSKVDPDGTLTPCAPFACKGGTCLAQCASTDDCSTGNVCSDRACVGVDAGGSSSSGGCATGGRPAREAAALAGLLALVGLVGTRRARRSRGRRAGLRSRPTADSTRKQ